jgi:hypothetical protein
MDELSEKEEYELDELLEGITPETIHGPMDWGPPVGKEFGASPPSDPSHDRTRLFYRLALACIIIGTIVQVIAIISRAQ